MRKKRQRTVREFLATKKNRRFHMRSEEERMKLRIKYALNRGQIKGKSRLRDSLNQEYRMVVDALKAELHKDRNYRRAVKKKNVRQIRAIKRSYGFAV